MADTEENTDLKSAIGRMIQAAQHEDTDDYTRSDLFDRYMGEPYGDEVQGRSAFVSTDVSDVVEATLADIMDVFTSSENIVEFEPVGPEDEDAAKQESDVVSHIFWQKNNGFLLLYSWIKESLIQQNSYVKRGWVEKERITIEEYDDLTPDELFTIIGQLDGEYEFLEYEGLTEDGQPVLEGVDPETGGPQFAPIRVKIRCTKIDKEYRIDCIPQEEFFHTPRWHSLDMTDIPCCGHRREMTRGELREMGFAEESIEAASQEQWNYQEEGRHNTRDHFETEYGDDEGDDSMKRATVYEAFVLADKNGDGKPERLKVWAIGDGSTIMKWENGEDAIEEVSGQPFSALTPIIVPHRHVGRSLAEQVDDIARVKTVLMRTTLDNIYGTTYARPYYDENMAGQHLARDLANPKPGAQVRTGGADVQWYVPQSVSGVTLPLMEVFDSLKENRTGAIRYSQGLDGESLNKTATGITKIMNAAQKKNALVARIMAETGMRDLFLGIHKDLRNGPMRRLVMRLRNEWIPVNPRLWRERTDMTVRVGMGSGDRDEKRTGLMMIQQAQTELMAAGSRMVDEKKLFNTAERLGETFGFKSMTPFFNDPDQFPEEPPEQPSPEQEMYQAQMQLQQQQMAMAQQESEKKFALERYKIDLEHQRKLEEIRLREDAEERQSAKVSADIISAQERLALDRRKAVLDDDFKRDKLVADAATGYLRDVNRNVNPQPPFSYETVTNGG